MMFYSQFLLEKKGPLGTIWIAAHLERKLRRNQVTGTNISAAVDSIISPEVPIALRLVGHLLLGVVRIYSKKVTYLYQDCSQTLTKINRAFHPVHVDLPPDANLAPFHSITLPEISEFEYMELDDVGFPSTSDSDPHVSTRDQITLHERHRDFASRVRFRSDECATSAGDAYTMLDFNEEAKRKISFQLETASSDTMSLAEDVLPPLPLDGPLGFNEMDVETGYSSSSSLNISTPPIPRGELTVEGTPQNVTMEPMTGANIPERETLRAAENVPLPEPHLVGMDEEPDAGEESTDTGGADEAQVTEMNEPLLEESPVPDKGVANIQMAPPTPPTKPTLISNDEDMLASVLGRVSPAFRVVSTPKTPASEERRLRPRKRKRSFDESIVLTNEFMKQQLTNTDDIRRIRRKVPFTSIEGLKSYKGSDIQQLFLEPSLPGMSVEIQRLYERICTNQEENISFGDVPRNLRPTSKELLEDRSEPSFHTSEIEEARCAPKANAVDTMEIPHKMDPQRERTKELMLEGQVPKVLPLDTATMPVIAQSTGLNVEISSPSLAAENFNAAETAPAGEAHCVEVSTYEKEGDQGLSFLEGDSTCMGNGVCAEGSRKASVGLDTNNLSTRTRAVAQYLKTAFQKSDTLQAGSKLNLDRVLSKSSRKEAGRMFFEILSLKSKDYIDVEQEEAYAGILVLVKPKLYTSNF